MTRPRITALAAGDACFRARHRTIQDRNVLTLPTGERVHRVLCDDATCRRYGTTIGHRPIRA